MSIRDKFLAVECRREAVFLPEIGLTVYVREKTARERTEFELETSDLKDQGVDVDKVSRGRTVVWVTEDEEGKPVFTEEDAELIDSRPRSLVDRIIDAHLKLNRSGEQAASGVAEKNGETAGGDSSAGSPSPAEEPTSNSSSENTLKPS